MKRPTCAESKTLQTLRRIALRYPETQAGVTCGKQAFKARNKAFLFLGRDGTSYNVLLKLRESLPEATQLAAANPSHYAVGGHQWVKVTFRYDDTPPPSLFERWIDESYRLIAPKALAALLPERGLPGKGVLKAAKTKTARKSA